MNRRPIMFLGKIYKTQTEFEQYIKTLLYNDIGICNDIKNIHPNYYNILIELLKRHPDFICKTQHMCNIKIVKNKLNINALEIIIINKDTSETDIAWSVAITGKHKTDKAELMSAMRSSIEEQIKYFRKNNKTKCTLCPNTQNLHVDHDTYFDELSANFIKIMKNENIKIPNKFNELNDDTHRRCFLDTDNLFEKNWVEYHKNNAKLRILCSNCNLTRPKSKTLQ